MATKITMTLSVDLSEQEQHLMRLLLHDVFSEFATKRTPAAQYVENRYPGEDVYSGKYRLEKLLQVERRTMLAQLMHAASFQAKIEVEKMHTNHAACLGPCSPGCMQPPVITVELLEEIAASGERHKAVTLLLEDLFDLSEEDARTLFNLLEDKRVNRILLAQGLTHPAVMTLEQIERIVHESLHAGLERLALCDKVLQVVFAMAEVDAKRTTTRLEMERLDHAEAGK